MTTRSLFAKTSASGRTAGAFSVIAILSVGVVGEAPMFPFEAGSES